MYPIMGGQRGSLGLADMAGGLERADRLIRRMELERRQDLDWETRAADPTTQQALERWLDVYGPVENWDPSVRAEFARRYKLDPAQAARGFRTGEARGYATGARRSIADEYQNAKTQMVTQIQDIRNRARLEGWKPERLAEAVKEIRGLAIDRMDFLKNIDEFQDPQSLLLIEHAKRRILPVDVGEGLLTPPRAPAAAMTPPPMGRPSSAPGIGQGFGAASQGIGFGEFRPRIQLPSPLGGSQRSPAGEVGGEVDPEDMALLQELYREILRRKRAGQGGIVQGPPITGPYGEPERVGPRPMPSFIGR